MAAREEDLALTVLEMRPMVPAKNFETSRPDRPLRSSLEIRPARLESEVTQSARNTLNPSRRGSALLDVRGVHKRRTGTRLGRTGPARSAVFAQDSPDEQNERENDALNGSGRSRNQL